MAKDDTIPRKGSKLQQRLNAKTWKCYYFCASFPASLLILPKSYRTIEIKKNFPYFFYGHWAQSEAHTMTYEMDVFILSFVFVTPFYLTFVYVRSVVHWCGSFAVQFSLHRFSATCETHKIYSMSHSLKPFYLSSSDCLVNSFPGPVYNNLSFAHQNYK